MVDAMEDPMEGSSNQSLELYNLVGLRQKELKECVSATKFPTLPFPPEEDTLPTSSEYANEEIEIDPEEDEMSTMTTTRTSSLVALIQHHKENIHELNIVDWSPSQRYQNYNERGSTVGTRQVKVVVDDHTPDKIPQCLFHLEVTQRMGNVTINILPLGGLASHGNRNEGYAARSWE